MWIFCGARFFTTKNLLTAQVCLPANKYAALHWCSNVLHTAKFIKMQGLIGQHGKKGSCVVGFLGKFFKIHHALGYSQQVRDSKFSCIYYDTADFIAMLSFPEWCFGTTLTSSTFLWKFLRMWPFRIDFIYQWCKDVNNLSWLASFCWPIRPAALEIRPRDSFRLIH